MNSAIPSTCMDRYLNRYIVPPHPVQQQQQQQQQQVQHQQLLNQQVAAAAAAAQNPNGFYQHQLLQQQQQQQQQQQAVQQQQVQGHGPPPHNFMVGCYNSANGWAGVPLISTAARRPRKFQPTGQNVAVNHYQTSNKADFDENAMSRLALHAHGAPLILTNNRYRSNNNNNNNKSGPNKPKQVPSNRDDHPHHHMKLAQSSANPQYTVVASHPNDNHSVASDESSPGTTNSSSSSISSDTCLPRIIKPRKRRKKDRKPNVQNGTSVNPSTVTSATLTTSAPSMTIDSVPTGLGPGQLAANAALLLDETTRDFLHEIALIANAGGHFNFSGLPLIREQQHPQQFPQQQQPQPTQLPTQHFSSSNSDSSDSGINSLACSCRLCDPFGKIWAFPLRRSCSDNSAEIELNRAKDVGVIGSNRSNSFRSEWRSSPHSLDQQQQAVQQEQQRHGQQLQSQDFGSGSSRKGSFSDSGDSGCDLLSGLTFCSEDILGSVNRELFLTPVDAGKEFKFPSTASGGGGGGGSIVNNSISISASDSVNAGENSSELLLISELTKKLNEGLDLGGRSSGSSDSGSSSSVFSDGGVFSSASAGGSSEGSPPGSGTAADLFVNFDAISRNNLFSVNNISKLSNLLFDDGLTAPGLVMGSQGQGVHNLNNNNNNNNSGVNYIRSQNLQPPPPPSANSLPPPSSSSTGQLHSHSNGNNSSSLFSDHQASSFIFGVPDVPDRGCEVLNCFDMVWSNDRKLLPVEE